MRKSGRRRNPPVEEVGGNEKDHHDGQRQQQEGVTDERTCEGAAGDGVSDEREKGRPDEDETEETERVEGESEPAAADQ